MRVVNEYVHVQVPATSANLGPGFDSLGLALNLVDDVEAWAMAGVTEIDIDGYGSDSLPRDDTHLIVRTVQYALDQAGAPHVGLRLKCHNRIPHGRGLGSSAAAIVAGLLIAKGMIDQPDFFDNDTLVDMGGRLEGHADNIAPAVLGGMTIAWSHSDDILNGPDFKAVKVPQIMLDHVTVCIPHSELLTTTARSVLPEKVPHIDAAANSARTALLVYALEHDESLLMDATKDYLHQSYRFDAMPDSVRLVERLRVRGVPAVISGAGPTILIFGNLDYATTTDMKDHGWDVRPLHVHHDGANIIK